MESHGKVMEFHLRFRVGTLRKALHFTQPSDPVVEQFSGTAESLADPVDEIHAIMYPIFLYARHRHLRFVQNA
jgi:hypothetical protein